MRAIVSIGICLLFCSVGGLANQASYKNFDASTLPQYSLSIHVVPDARRLEVTGTMSLPAANVPRDSVELSLSELMTDFRVEVVGPESAAGHAQTAKVAVRPYSRPGWGTATWRVHFAHPISAGTPALLRFTCSGGGAHPSFIFS